MRVLDLTALGGRRIDAHGSKGFSVAAFGLTAEAHLVTVTLAPGGVIGRHPAAARQLLVVLDGEAVVSGGSDGTGEAVTVGPGHAVVWEPYEPHETRTVDGLVALVLEGEVEVGTPGHHVDPGDV